MRTVGTEGLHGSSLAVHGGKEEMDTGAVWGFDRPPQNEQNCGCLSKSQAGDWQAGTAEEQSERMVEPENR